MQVASFRDLLQLQVASYSDMLPMQFANFQGFVATAGRQL
jgi:hypothetical protein